MGECPRTDKGNKALCRLPEIRFLICLLWCCIGATRHRRNGMAQMSWTKMAQLQNDPKWPILTTFVQLNTKLIIPGGQTYQGWGGRGGGGGGRRGRRGKFPRGTNVWGESVWGTISGASNLKCHKIKHLKIK